MKSLQSIFDETQQIKKQQKELNKIYRESLNSSFRYQEILEKLDKLKTEKKQIEENAKNDMGSDYTKLERLKEEVKDNRTMMADVAINHLMKGQVIEISDEYNNQYEPRFSVTFKKI